MGLARRAVCCATADEAARVLERGQGRSDDTAWASKGRSGYDKAGHGPAAGEGEARWDVVLVWTKPRLTAEGGALSVSELRRREAQVQERKQKLEALFAGLESVGLLLSSFKEEAEDGTDARHFMLVAAPHSLTLEAAEAIKMVKRLKPASGDSESKPLYDVYTIEKHDLFAEDAFREGCYFTSLERIECIFHLIEAPDHMRPGCAGIDLDKLVGEGVLDSYFCLDDGARLAHLQREWISVPSLSSLFAEPPIAQIRDYLGEKVALYFAWMHLYTSWLSMLALISLVPFGYSLVWKGSPTGTPYDNWAMPIYGLLSMVWAQLFLEAWKREQSKYAFLWRKEDFEEQEGARPEYRNRVQALKSEWEARNEGRGDERPWLQRVIDPRKGDVKKGKWSSAGFVDVGHLEDPELVKNTSPVEWFNPRVKLFRVCVSTVIGLTLVAVIGFATVLIQSMKTYIAIVYGREYEDRAQYFAAFVQSGFIMTMTVLWNKVGPRIVNWEMHRTDTQWEDALMMKTFAFQFINSYGPALYIAFVQGHVALPILYVGVDEHGERIPLVDKCVDDKCYKALYVQMLIIILSKQVSRNVMAIGPPIYRQLKSRLFSYKNTNAHKLDELQLSVIRQSHLAHFKGTHTEYLEMAIQFGYVSIFAVAFPIGSIVCLLNNLLERRTDALKLAVLMRRPRYLGAQDIGSMQNILEFIALVSVLVNCGILYLSSDAYYAYFPQSWGPRPNFNVFIFTVVVEHLILMVKGLVSALVPDTPDWVEQERAKAKMREEAYRLAHLSAAQLARRAEMQQARENKSWEWTSWLEADMGALPLPFIGDVAALLGGRPVGTHHARS